MRESKKADWKTELAQLAEKLRDPFRMRMTVACCVAVIFVVVISDPIENRIRESRRDTKRLKSTIHTAEEVELLRIALGRVDPMVLQGSGMDAVLKHLIQGFRDTPVSLMRIEPEAPVSVGPFESVRVTAEVKGEYQDFHRLLTRLDNDAHLLRVESVAMQAAKTSDEPATMQVVLRMLQEST